MAQITDLTSECLETVDATPEMAEYVFQLLDGLWDMGVCSEDIMTLIEKNQSPAYQNLLDLGCGKGSVCIKAAQKFGYHTTGIDGMSEFIAEAQRKAIEHGITEKCDFKQDDIKKFILSSSTFDIVVWGAVGNILGDIRDTIAAIKKLTSPGGLIVIADGVLADNQDKTLDNYFNFSHTKRLIESVGVKIIDYHLDSEEETRQGNDFNNQVIKKNAEVLKTKHPNKAQLFDLYVENQVKESDILNQTLGIVWIARREE